MGRINHWLAGLGAAFILLVSAASKTSADTHGDSVPQLDFLSEQFDLHRPSFRPVEAASCSLKNHVPTAMAYYSGIQPGFRFASYMNPANCVGSLDYPYAIYFVSFPLFHFSGAHWPLGIKLQVWSALPTDSCAGPQELLHSRHYLLDSASFMAPKVGVIQLLDPVCVSGPFYISIEYDGSTAQPYPSVLFDTIVPPVQCLNWGYRDGDWHTWSEFWTGPIAGNFMVWVDGYSNSNYCVTDEDTVRTLEGLHQQLDSLSGRRISVVGYYTDSAEGKLVSFYPDYLENSPMPPRSEAFVVGPQPHDSFAGALVMATGYLHSQDDPAPLSPLDNDELQLYAPRWQKVLNAPGYPSPTGDSSTFWEDPDICREEKVALLIGGGPNTTNNHRRYWGELVMAYNTLHVPNDYCSNNVTVLYAEGQSANPLSIPQSVVHWYSKTAVDSAFAAIARASASRVRSGHGGLSLNLFITGQTSPLGLVTTGGSVITPAELRTWLQRTLDSSVFEIEITLTTSAGGTFANELLALNTHGQARVTVSTATGTGSGWSGPNASPYWQTYLDTLLVNWISGSRSAAASSVISFNDTLRNAMTALRNDARAWLIAHPAGSVLDSLRLKVVADTTRLNTRISQVTSILATSDARPWLWERDLHAYYGTWRPFCIPRLGQLTLTFTGDTSTSGSVTMYEDSGSISWYTKHKRAVWNWNIPGSTAYTSGNESRTLLNNRTETSNFWMHCDEPTFVYTARLRTDQPGSPSPSNPYALPGFSIGGEAQGRDAMNLAPPLFDTVLAPELPGVSLKDISARWGACGSSELVNRFTVPAITPWHAAMEVRIRVFQVVTPGAINISIPGAATSAGTITVNSPGTYRFDCGSFSGTGTQELKFTVSTGCFVIDAYSLRSTIIDPPSCCVGTTGNVNNLGPVDLSDLSLLIGYLTAGFAAPACPEEADINISGKVDLSDLSLLIAYLVSGSITFPNCP